ncbi:hypothetical protein PLICRDRAFT_116940 [Plicaturopsis crispa FD-325 SS-3]|uniref:RING-type E3 ubiquitin transferase n=1 Tax=Plicaturopsis crispa FD-325 SS-3 TaxID=944288 RepID=A0A0C9T9I0_PLICR|nr:hypothetical protein PLICRDRAFT_116940 [Plicaturopsis crispa FD-325 SS-3]
MASPSKRIKLESSPTPSSSSPPKPKPTIDAEDTDTEEEHCSICLQPLADRTVIPTCSHEFCFECLLVWTEQSRKCPLCAQLVGEYLIHRIRSRYDYQKHYLARLRTSPAPQAVRQAIRQRRSAREREWTAREREWGRRERRAREEADELERAIARRRWVYEHDLYAKHVASNSYTRYRPYPTPAQFSASADLVSRTTAFLRRELRVWVDLDVEVRSYSLSHSL